MQESNTDIQVAKQTAKKLGFKFMDYENLANIPITQELLTLEDIENLHLIPLTHTGYKLVYAMTTKTPRSSIKKVSSENQGENIQIVVITEQTYQKLYQKFLDKFRPHLDPLADLNRPLSEVPKNLLFDFILLKAVKMNASDIHIEPGEPGKIRFRVDGVLQNIADIDENDQKSITGELRVNSNMLGGSKSKTGHISKTIQRESAENVEVNARVESVKSVDGYDYVVRLFTFDDSYLNIDHLGFREKDKEKIVDALNSNDQMILVSGPTGSGKSTTLYSLINYRKDESVKIVTLEDPVEYELKDITQIQVDTDKGETFSERLRSILREDPDVLMVGEMRDGDTLKTAMESAQTGHLILTTYHASSAASALRRLLNQAQNPSLVVASLKIAIGQRLVRRLCDHCKHEVEPNEEQSSLIEEELSNLEEELDFSLENIKLYESEGCDECYGLGYKGRMLIYELLEMTENIEREVLSNEQLLESDILGLAKEQGMATMLQDGLLKAVKGETSYEEVIKSVGK